MTLGSAPTAVAYNAAAPYIGTVVNGTVSGSNFNNGTSPVSINIATPGTYLFSFSIGVNNNVSSASGTFVGTNTPAGLACTFPVGVVNVATFFVVGSIIIQQASGIYGVNIGTSPNVTLTGAGSNFGFFTAVRIA